MIKRLIMAFTPTRYFLQSVKTGQQFPDAGWTLDAPGESSPTLIRAIYENRRLTLRNDLPGLYRFADWLPIGRILEGSSAPVTYKSEKLASSLGLSNLWITFSGYWPEIGAGMTTCSFKETEAYTVCARLQPDSKKILVVASAGNTARAFAKVCSDNRIPLLLCVPEDNLDALWFEEYLDPCVKLICSKKGGDYFDAIHLSNIVASMEGFIAEGGAKNVARRDGMGTTVLSAATTIGQIPDYYFQAVGSGTGAIAAWEANLRLLCDGRFGTNKMKLMVSQNAPFQPMYDAWKQGSRNLLPFDDQVARSQVETIDAKVLSNRKPPYPPAGGLFDALTDTNGDVLLATNEQAWKASELFRETEGIDIHCAAAVATASLIEAVHDKTIDPDAIIMLNITGGGEEKFKGGNKLAYLQPSFVFPVDPNAEEVKKEIGRLF
jgi:cysteate synthase